MGSYLEKFEEAIKKKLRQQGKGATVVRTYSGEDTWIASVSYVPFVSAAVLVLRKNNSEFVSFHARQALVILIIVILALMLLPLILKMLAAVVGYGLLVYGAYYALSGRKWYLPIVTELARTIEI
ncbi:MAG: hypothetical protein A2Z42_02515 [Candidatus Woykebacteria bacterium RBG_19FT_COMBO_43_10]|uniref:Uncharacterized protein n=1 Tax=Candidatus Woykebacteria bacterium RBG_19FT_COMBO_43_10 TaxID=1802598 RepID=A0A1G1WK36_9BACT|nr:MAG: hypothetical protein A2Z42_02515 [Candidatus Woykebacteria bacterium RBG_19FT_COMBO_43_10]